MSTDHQDTIIIKAPAGTKARWVKQAQREGMKLSDWVIRHVEVSMRQAAAARVVIPGDIKFSDLKLGRDPSTGDMEFDWLPIERICKASGLSVSLFRDQSEDNLGGLLAHWYARHRADGGEPDKVMDDLIAEADIEDSHGHGFSHQPGRA